MAAQINEIAQDFVAQAPQRLKAMAVLPMQDPAAAANELKRCVLEKHFVGGFIHGQTGLGDYPYYDDPCYDVLWIRWRALDVPLFIHPRSPEADQVRAFKGCEELLGNTWDWGFVTGTLVLRMCLTAFLNAHPKLKVRSDIWVRRCRIV